MPRRAQSCSTRARLRGAVAAASAAQARDIHMRAIVVDGHADTIGRILDRGEDIGIKTATGHIDLPRMLEGGHDAQFFACFVDPKYIPRKECVLRVLRMIDALKRTIARHPRKIALARTAADVRRIVRSGRVAGILCIEGGHAIDDDLGVLRMFHELGIRYMTLTWNNSNNWADGCGEPPRHHGLTEFGREVVREMNRIGMIVDVSHVAEKTFWDALETTRVPVMASHSSCKSICNHRRNLTDDQLRAVAKNGGVVCVNFYSGFVSQPFYDEKKKLDEKRIAEHEAAKKRFDSDTKALDAAAAEIEKRFDALERQIPPPSLDVLVDHIDHIAKVAGVDHAGIGGDFDGVPCLPADIGDSAQLPNLTTRLLARGYTAKDIHKILGGNVLRVMAAAVDSRLTG